MFKEVPPHFLVDLRLCRQEPRRKQAQSPSSAHHQQKRPQSKAKCGVILTTSHTRLQRAQHQVSIHPKDPQLQGRKTGSETPTQPMGAGHALLWVIPQQKAVVGQPELGNQKSSLI